MIRATAQRRGLVGATAADLIGQVYNQRKQANGCDRKSNPQNEDLIGRESQAVADELGVGRATVERGGSYAAAIDRLTALLGVEREELLEPLEPDRTDRARRARVAAAHGAGGSVGARPIPSVIVEHGGREIVPPAGKIRPPPARAGH